MQTRPVSPPRPPATSATPQPAQRDNPNYLQLRWLNAALGKPVGLEMMDGDRIEGKLVGFDQYTLLVEPPGQPARLVWKHAVTYMQLTSEGSPG